MPRILPAVLPTLAMLTAAVVGVHSAARFLPPLPELTVTADPGPAEVPE